MAAVQANKFYDKNFNEFVIWPVMKQFETQIMSDNLQTTGNRRLPLPIPANFNKYLQDPNASKKLAIKQKEFRPLPLGKF